MTGSGAKRDTLLDALETARRIALGEFSAEQVMGTTLERIDRVDTQVHAFACVRAEAAMRAARALDAELATQSTRGRAQRLLCQPFLGVPMALKDLGLAASDLPSTMGSRFFGTVQWQEDAELVARYRRAGMIPIGRTTTSELGLGPSSEAVAYGAPTQNPWRSGYSAGGSSGGSAAAVASGMLTIAHAGDGAGSARIPAACCGLLGLKPSRGLLPSGPQRAEGWGGLVTDHVLTTTVRDCAAALDATAGADLGAPYAAPASAVTYTSLLAPVAADPMALECRRIAVLRTTFEGDPVHPEVMAAVDECALLLESCGHRVELAAPPVGSAEVTLAMLPSIACAAAELIARRASQLGREPTDAELEATTLGACRYARTVGGVDYLATQSSANRVRRSVARFLDASVQGGFDLLLGPVLSAPPAELGCLRMDNPDYLDYRLGPRGLLNYSPFAPLANLTGMPAISIPFGRSRLGLPIGIQLMAPFGAEGWLLTMAAQIEALRPWPRTAP